MASSNAVVLKACGVVLANEPELDLNKNIFAFTPPGTLPPYISVNAMPGKQVSVIVRSRSKYDGGNGECAEILLSASQALTLARSIQDSFGRGEF